MAADLPEHLNIADHFLTERVREGRGTQPAVITDARTWTYLEIYELAGRFAGALAEAGVQPEQRVIIALPDGPEFVGAFFGTLKLGAVVVMANPALAAADAVRLLEYSRARAVITHEDVVENYRSTFGGARPPVLLTVGGDLDRRLAAASAAFPSFESHRDDAAIWLFSGGTTGRPKAVVQTHRSFVNTTRLYARGVLDYSERDITLSVPKLYFGYATGSNLLFPFAAGAATILFPEPVTAEMLFERIRRQRPTILINVPTMINKMVSHPEAASQDLSSLRLCTSAGEALPVELHRRWTETFGVDLLDGLGTAEMWHIFISNRPGAARPGTLGQVVPGFEVRVCDEQGNDLPDGETGWLWVRGDSRAIAYWQHMEKTAAAFRGEWYVSGDLIARDSEGFITYHGRGDEMLKVAGKWLAPQEVEGCLLEHPAVAEAAVVGIHDANGLMKPHAYVVARERHENLAEELKEHVRSRLEPYKHPREVIFLDVLPRTHLGKVDRGKLRRG